MPGPSSFLFPHLSHHQWTRPAYLFHQVNKRPCPDDERREEGGRRIFYPLETNDPQKPKRHKKLLMMNRQGRDSVLHHQIHSFLGGFLSRIIISLHGNVLSRARVDRPGIYQPNQAFTPKPSRR